MSAPVGNKNASKGKEWNDAIRRALAKDKLALVRVAEKLIKSAEGGDIQAIKELGDRLDGKPAQAMAITGKDDGPIQHEVITRPQLSKEEWLTAHHVGTPARTAK